jgi:hypothetical protein
VHAAFSLYWALGGDWLLNTVGAWAVDLVRSAPLLSALALVVVAIVKFAAATFPLLVYHERLPWRRFWRVASGVGSVVLIVYGALNTVVAWAVLMGILTSSDGYDHAALLGHAALWDPLFLIWGGLLAAGLRLTRGPVGVSDSPRSGSVDPQFAGR